MKKEKLNSIYCFFVNAFTKEKRFDGLIIFSLILLTFLLLFYIIKLCQVDVLHLGYIDLVSSGQVGDFVGGVFGTILSLLTIVALYFSYQSQRTQFNTLRVDQNNNHSREISNQNFLHEEMIRTQTIQHQESIYNAGIQLRVNSLDTKFFHLFNMLDSYVSKIHLINELAGPNSKDHFGRNALLYAIEKLYNPAFKDANVIIDVELLSKFRRKSKKQFDFYFGVLISMYKLVKESGLESDFYLNLLKSVLSNEELLIVNLYFLDPKINIALKLQFYSDGFFDEVIDLPNFAKHSL